MKINDFCGTNDREGAQVMLHLSGGKIWCVKARFSFHAFSFSGDQPQYLLSSLFLFFFLFFFYSFLFFFFSCAPWSNFLGLKIICFNFVSPLFRRGGELAPLLRLRRSFFEVEIKMQSRGAPWIGTGDRSSSVLARDTTPHVNNQSSPPNQFVRF